MADRLFDRAFNKALSHQKRAVERVEAERPLTAEQKQAEEDDKLRRENKAMTTEDAIKRILLADKDKDYFRLLELDPPSLDALGRPIWPCTASDISTAFRRLSPLVHPDKNPGTDAREAFEALNRAKKLLGDPNKRDEVLSKHLDAAKRRQTESESGATAEERQVLYANKRVEAQALQREEAEKYKLEVLQQQKRLQDRARRKKELQQRANKRHNSDEEKSEDSEAEENFPKKKAKAVDKKKRPRLIF